MTNGQHYFFHSDVIQHLDATIASVAALTPSYTTYKAAFDEEDIVFKRSQKFEETESLKEADKARDTVLSTLRKLVNLTYVSTWDCVPITQ
jgi:hypothetical protein